MANYRCLLNYRGQFFKWSRLRKISVTVLKYIIESFKISDKSYSSLSLKGIRIFLYIFIDFSSGSVRINAERIINKGLISAENAGILDLEGHDVNLVRGGIEIKSGPNFDHPNGLDDFGQPLAWGYNLNYLNGSLGPYQQRRFSSNPGGAGILLVKQ